MTRSALIIVSTLMAVSAVAGNEQETLGVPRDQRIAECGIRTVGDDVVAITPFVSAAIDLVGNYRLEVRKVSSSGTSQVAQSGAFSGGTLGDGSVKVDGSGEIFAKLTIADQTGAILCAVDATFDNVVVL